MKTTKQRRPGPTQPGRQPSPAMQQYFADIRKATCPKCGQPMQTRMIGRDVYALPCRHRLYQGKL